MGEGSKGGEREDVNKRYGNTITKDMGATDGLISEEMEKKVDVR